MGDIVEKELLKKYIIYARYSSSLQNMRSIEDQVSLCHDYVENCDGVVVSIYSDEVKSGKSLKTRSGIMSLLEAIKESDITGVVCEALDRLSRDQENIAKIYKLLSFYNVELFTLAEGKVDELHIGLKGTMNALFLKDLALKTKRGMIGRVRRGFTAGGRSYGYRVKKDYDEKGEVIRGLREIIPEEAEVVIRIFEEAGEGVNSHQIARRLNADKIPGPRGKEWTQSTINGNRKRRNGILNNELYSGYIVFNRQTYKTDPITGKRRSFINPTEKWEVIEKFNLRIVPEKLWEKVQKLRRGSVKPKDNKQGPISYKKPAVRPLTHKLKCGICGGGMTMVGNYRYMCIRARERGTCSNDRGVSAYHLEKKVLLMLRSKLILMDDKILWLTDMGLLQEKEAEFLRNAKAELEKMKPRISRIVEAIASGVDTSEMRLILLKMDQRKTILKKRITSSKVPHLDFTHKDAILILRAILNWIEEGFKIKPTPSDIVKALRSCVDEVILRPRLNRKTGVNIEILPAWSVIVDMVIQEYAITKKLNKEKKVLKNK
jgi:DNA invertase Pin-like site-specific DNA recombinase